jgi:hypothetical protein
LHHALQVSEAAGRTNKFKLYPKNQPFGDIRTAGAHPFLQSRLALMTATMEHGNFSFNPAKKNLALINEIKSRVKSFTQNGKLQTPIYG